MRTAGLSVWNGAGAGRIISLLVLCAAYYAGTLLGYALIFPSSFFSIIWPPNTILLVALLCSSPRQWLWLLLLAFPVHLLAQAQFEVSLGSAALYYLYDCVLVLLTTGALRGAGLGDLALADLRQALLFIVITTVTVAVGSLVWSPLIASFRGDDHLTMQWTLLSLSNLLPFLAGTPWLVVLAKHGTGRFTKTRPSRYTEFAILTLCLLACAVVIFGIAPREIASPAALFYVPLPFLLWGAVRFGPSGLSFLFLIFALMVIFSAVGGNGPFVSDSAGDSMLRLQLLLLALYVPLLVLASVVQERRRNEDLLRRSEARYRAVVEDQTELICRFLHDGTYTFVNEAYCRYFQHTEKELLGRSFWMFIPPEQHGAARQSIAAITVDQPVSTCEHEVIAPGGEIRWQQWRNRGLFDAHGRVVEFQAVGRDVTELRQAHEEHRQLEAQRLVEATLRESEARFRQIADSMPQIAWTARSDGHIDYFNRKWYEITGASEQLTSTDAWLPVLHADDRQSCLDRWAESLRTGQQYQCEARFLCGDGGAYRWHLMRALPQLDPAGRVLGWYGTCTDIDDQKRAEQGLLDADRRKDEFLAMLAHELRNPLAPVRMAVEIMRRESVSEEVGRARDVIGRQVDHLVRLVDDLLDVSRITQGKIKLNKAMVDIERVIALAVETSRPLIESRRQMLSLEIRQKPLHVFGDAVRLAQIVSNLLNNAAKYTDEGGRIQLTVARSGSDLTITVKDNGIGLPKEMLGRIFELFVQVGGDQERAQGGLGIGLTLVNSLVQMHGGSVEARSPGLGLGSEFVVRLPVSILQERTPAAAAPTTEGPPTPSRRILIVDDNVDLTRTLARLLSNHCVRVAHDGISALETIPSFDPDVVVLDLGLPRMDGFQIARRIRQEPRNKPPILIAMSGYGQEEDRRRSKEAGFDHHLVKPISLADLESLLDGHASAVAERVPVTSRSV